MTTATPNSADLDMFNDLANDNEVQSRSDYKHGPADAVIRKVLHPPSAVPEYCGLPTNDARSQVTVEWRDIELMNTPFVYDATAGFRPVTASDLDTFDIGLLIPNGARVKSIAYIYDKKAGRMMQDTNNLMAEKMYDFITWRLDVNLYRPAYKSSTFYLNATAFNDTGVVAGNQFNPNIMFQDVLADLPDANPRLFYALVRSLYQSGRAKVIRNGDRNALERWESFPLHHRNELVRRLNLAANEALDLDPNAQHQIVSFGRLSSLDGIQNVPTTTEILGNSLRSLACKAKEGMFSVQRLNTISPAWLSSGNTVNPGGQYDKFPSLLQCYYAEMDGTGYDYVVQPFLENATVGQKVADVPVLSDTMWSKDMTWSWVRFSGLSLNSQTNLSTQLLIKKVYTGLEIQPNPTSAWAGMLKLGPKPDLACMQAMMDGFYELKDVMPARYNFWGTIGTIAANGLATFGTSLLQRLAEKVSGGKSKPAEPAADRIRSRAATRAREPARDAGIEQLARFVQQLGIGQQRGRGRVSGRRHNSPAAPPVRRVRRKPAPVVKTKGQPSRKRATRARA